nr:epimerase [Treponema sp.]
ANSNEPITEKSPRLLDVSNDEKFLATDLYPLTKARQENILFENEKKNWTIIRPYITYSENRLQLGVLEKETWLFTALNCQALVFSKDISRHITTLTYAFDVARGITAIIGNEKAYGEAFHITGSKTIKWKEVFNLYSQVLRSNGVKIEEIMKEKTHRLDYDWSKYQVLYDRYFDRVFDNSKIAQFVDVDSFVKPEEGLRNCLEKLIKEPCFNYVAVEGVLLVLQGTKKKLRLKKIPQIKQKIKFILIRLHMYPL